MALFYLPYGSHICSQIVRQGIDPTLKEKEKALQARTSWIQNQLIQIHSRPKPDQSKIAAFADELKKTEDNREQLEAEIRQKHPRYAQLHYPTPLSLKAIQQLLDDRTALLEYSQGKAASFLFAVSKNDFLVARLPADSSLMNRVRKVREAIADKPNRQMLSNYLLNARAVPGADPAGSPDTGWQEVVDHRCRWHLKLSALRGVARI